MPDRGGVTRVRLLRVPSGADVFAGPSPGGGSAGWYLVVLRLRRQAAPWVAALRVEWRDADGPREVLLARPYRGWLFGFKLGVLFLRADVAGFSVRLHDAADPPGAIELRLCPVPAAVAAAGVVLQNPGAFRAAFRTAVGGWAARLRGGIAAAAVAGQRMDVPYPEWVRVFDAWPARRLRALAATLPARPAVGALVFRTADGTAALAATIASLDAQAYAAAAVVVAEPGMDGAAAAVAARCDYVAVLQAGEVLPPQALLLLVHELGGAGPVDALYADEDTLRPDGTRADPWFKPQPGLAMMGSGLLSRGVWLVRAPLLRTAGDAAGAANWAECARLAVWFLLRATGRAGGVRRVPCVLTHRRTDAEAAPPAVLAAAVDAGLRRIGVAATADPGFPLRLRWGGGGDGKVSLVVPSRLRGTVQLGCMLDVLARTARRNIEMVVVVTQDGPLDAEQREAARRLRQAGPARVELLRRPAFNWSLASNFGARRTDGAFLCLLNDDVSTLDGAGDWLDRMVAVFADPTVGIVGAKLYYPDLTVQHGGVVMGLAGLVEHAHRFLPRGEPGYMGRAALDQDVSVVTGAALLVRRTVFEAVGGLDERLPTAFNDVDFCLRVRAAGHGVVLAASVELVHHETLSFGDHYAGAAEKAAADVRLLRDRWPGAIAADPFHNPNLSLLPGAEWTLACPPRTAPDGP